MNSKSPPDLIERILAKQNPGGYWYEPENFYVYTKYKGTVWSLILLAELGANKEDQRIKDACEFILTWSQHRESGGFAFKGSAEKGGESDCIIPCLSGNMVWSLLRFGYFPDPRLQHGIEWITRYQRFDDAEGKAPNEFPYNNEHCWGKHSCMLGVVKTLRAFAEIPEDKRTGPVHDTIKNGVDFILRHRVFLHSHDPRTIANAAWLGLGYPHMWNTDILEMVRILKKLNIRDERMLPAIEQIRAKQGSDGFWINENSMEGRMAVILERQGQPSPWITQKAVDVLDWWDQQS